MHVCIYHYESSSETEPSSIISLFKVKCYGIIHLVRMYYIRLRIRG